MPSYLFEKTDAGRSESKRPRQKIDCTVRALALACNVEYDKAYDELKERGRKSHARHNFPKKRSNDEAFGFKFTWKSFPAIKGQKRMNPVSFCNSFPKGTYICRTAKHVFAVLNGVIHDLEPERDDRCIYGCWMVTKLG
jgi:hypothetical protein